MKAAIGTKLKEFYASPTKIGENGKEYPINKTSLQFVEAATLQELVLQTKAARTLEIGLALGSSAVAIAEALDNKGGDSVHVALDPFQNDFGNVALRELERLKLRHKVEFHAETSEDFLPRTVKSGEHFDF